MPPTSTSLRILRRSLIAGASLLFLQDAIAGVALLQPGKRIDGTQPLQLTLLVSDDNLPQQQYEIPRQLMVAVSADMIPPQQLALQRDGDGNDQITLRKGEFRKYTYSAVLPPNMRGNVRIEPVGLDAAPMMLVVVRPDPALGPLAPVPFMADAPLAHSDSATAPVTPAASVITPGANAVANTSAPAALDLINTSRLTFNEPMYFVAGNSGGNSNAKFQLSFKYRIFQPDDPRSHGLIDNLYFAYTQFSLWDLQSPSAPFRDTNYRPSLYYFLPDLGIQNGILSRMAVATGLEHESNGRDGAQSRSINMAFVRPTFSFGNLNGVYRKLLDGAGVNVIDGFAVIEDAHTVRVGEQRFTAEHILIATGGQPSVPDFPGSAHAITSDGFFRLPALPARTVVMGGGYIAVELASILNGLGSQVTLVYRGKQLLRTMDAELGVFLAAEMQKKGMQILFETTIAGIEQGAGGKTVVLDDGRRIDADCVLLATGRDANTAQLGLGNAGVATKDNGAIVVNEQFATNVPSIHAIGDVIDRIALTPVALAEGMAVAGRLFNKSARSVSYDNVPTAVFSHPNVATVGLSEEQARRKFTGLRIFKSEFKPLKHTLSGNPERTFMKLVVDAASDKVLGVHMVGAEAGEIMQGFAVALQCGATKAQFDATIGIHPTAAEEFVTMRTPV